MFIYYKQKEIDDLKKVDSINATLAKAVEGVKEFIGRSFNRLNWCIILSGTMTFKEVLLIAYAQTHVSEKDIEENPNREIYAYVCPKEIQEFGDMITKELGKIKFPTDVIIFTKCTTMPPTISPELIKKYYPRLYTLEVDKLSPEAIAEKKKSAEGSNSTFSGIENIKTYTSRVQVYTSTPRPGFHRLANGKMTFSETDYYRDVVKMKLNV